MTPKDRSAIDNFLDILQSTSRGCAIVINMYDSCAEALVSPDFLSAFLLDCVQTLESNPSKDAITIVEDVSCGYGSAKQSYLRQCKQKPFSNRMKRRLSNTMNTVSFHSFILDEKYKSGSGSLLPIILPQKPVDTASGLREYQTRLSEITADSTWKNPAATLGKPLHLPSNCWITTNHFGNVNTPKYPDDPATETRDKLGLIDCSDGSFLLRLSFLASSITKISDNELARPVFSDLGNSRFRVHQSSKRAIKFANQGWGATIHLGRFGNKEFRNSTGGCERVSSALPLAKLESLTIEFLGKVTEDRGKGTHDDDVAYANELQAKRTPIQIKNELLSFLE